jgi:hypothetical protein
MLYIQRLKAKNKSETVSEAKGDGKAVCEGLADAKWNSSASKNGSSRYRIRPASGIGNIGKQAISAR